MTEEVFVSVKGLHAMKGSGDDEIEMISPGKYYNKNGNHYVVYEELLDESHDLVRNYIKLSDGHMEVRKKGALQSELVFDPGRRNSSWYSTPYGSMVAGIEVNSMKVSESSDLIQVDVDYSLAMNYEHLADCSITVKIMAKDSGLLKLS